MNETTNKKIEIKVPSVPLVHLKKMIESVEKTCENENIELSFEYVLASCFPTCWNNIQETLSRQYTLGYIQGIKDAEENLKNN